MSLGQIPFHVPLEYLSRVDAGELVRYGTILKDVTDGKIVAHLQQSGVFDHVLSTAVSGAGQVVQSSTGPVGMLASVATVAQNQQIKGQLSGLTDMVGNLQALSLVGTVASVAGIGVTVASTAILMKRIKAVDSSIVRLGEQMSQMQAHLREQDLHRALHRVDDTMEKLAEAPFRKNAAGTEKVLNDVEENLRTGFNELLLGARVVADFDVIDAELLRTLIAGLATCAAAQSKTLVWLNEISLARTRAQNQAQKLNELARLMPSDVIEAKLGGDAGAAAQLGFDMRELRAVAASRPAFMERILALEISGPDYLAQAQERDDAPVLMLPSSGVRPV